MRTHVGVDVPSGEDETDRPSGQVVKVVETRIVEPAARPACLVADREHGEILWRSAPEYNPPQASPDHRASCAPEHVSACAELEYADARKRRSVRRHRVQRSRQPSTSSTAQVRTATTRVRTAAKCRWSSRPNDAERPLCGPGDLPRDSHLWPAAGSGTGHFRCWEPVLVGNAGAGRGARDTDHILGALIGR